jgi:hypothetical protein
MKKILAFLALSAALITPSHADVVYTSSASFLAQVAAGSYTNNFDGLSNPAPGSVAFSGGGFSYSAFAPSDIYLEGGFLGTSQIDEALTITFDNGNVFAVGANFFAVDIQDDFQQVSLTLTLSNGTTETFTPNSLVDSYRGFISDFAITSLIISGPGASLYAGLDNLTVGMELVTGTVPEPGSWALLALGLAGFLVVRRRTV